MAITVGVLLISLIRLGIQIWGRWHATRVTKLIQMAVRKRVFAHAIRLPLYRVQELKSGGATSILRQDAGSVDLVLDADDHVVYSEQIPEITQEPAQDQRHVRCRLIGDEK